MLILLYVQTPLRLNDALEKQSLVYAQAPLRLFPDTLRDGSEYRGASGEIRFFVRISFVEKLFYL
jgi:hypothetical protein